MRHSMVFTCMALTFIAFASFAAPQSDLLVSTDWLDRHLGDPPMIVVEVGERETFERGHIPGARFIALNDLLVTRDSIPNELPDPAALEATFRLAGVPDRGRIILYSHDIITAARAFFTLDYLGHGGRTALLDGGYAKWNAERKPIELGAPSPVDPTAFVARGRPESIVRLHAMRILVNQAEIAPEQIAIIDARSPRQYLGSEPGLGVIVGGHIPQAINVPSPVNLTAEGIFRSPNELRAIYRAAGIDERAIAVVYCRTGMQASVTYFVFRYLGRDVHLYDGSYIEWSRAEYSAEPAGSSPVE